MRTSDFEYHLPKELIAQIPPEERGGSRLMVLHRDPQQLEHKQFPDLLGYLCSGDILVVNDSKVVPARLYGINQETKTPIEVLLVKRLSDNHWAVMAQPGKKTRPGAKLSFGEGQLTAEVIPNTSDGYREIEFSFQGTWESVIAELGVMPVPPYIERTAEMKDLLQLDKTRYQTVYASQEGSIAAPTAGLHFSEKLLQKINDKGILLAKVTLHVGTGTFLSVKTETLEEHPMHSEWYSLSQETVDQINIARQNGGRVIAVGTTACRVLESASDSSGNLKPGSGDTNLFIYPGYQFKIVNCLITNFHLPKSTLLMLVSALAGKEFIFQAYEAAVREKYRFFSYGDAMLIV